MDTAIPVLLPTEGTLDYSSRNLLRIIAEYFDSINKISKCNNLPLDFFFCR